MTCNVLTVILWMSSLQWMPYWDCLLLSLSVEDDHLVLCIISGGLHASHCFCLLTSAIAIDTRYQDFRPSICHLHVVGVFKVVGSLPSEMD